MHWNDAKFYGIACPDHWSSDFLCDWARSHDGFGHLGGIYLEGILERSLFGTSTAPCYVCLLHRWAAGCRRGPGVDSLKKTCATQLIFSRVITVRVIDWNVVRLIIRNKNQQTWKFPLSYRGRLCQRASLPFRNQRHAVERRRSGPQKQAVMQFTKVYIFVTKTLPKRVYLEARLFATEAINKDSLPIRREGGSLKAKSDPT